MSDPTPVTVWITRTVKHGREMEFERALHDFFQRSLKHPGQLGVHVERPAPGGDSRDYRIVRKFTSRAALDAFRVSPEYRGWNDAVRDITEGEPRVEELSGLESWFTPAGAPLHPLPRWKMALVTFLGVYLLTSVLPPLVARILHGWPPAFIHMLVTALVVASLTWAVMPLLTRLFHRWLHT